MKLSNYINNQECFNKVVTAQPNSDSPWVTCTDGNDGEENYYRDVYTDGILAYCDGESCIILGADNNNDTVALKNDEEQVFSIPYEQYVADFGMNLR